MNMSTRLHLLSSMATQHILAALCAEYQQATGVPVHVESVGGVDAAKRVRTGEAFDVVLLAQNALAGLMADGHLRAGSLHDLFVSGVAVGVREGAPVPAIDTEEAVKRAVLTAASIGYSTGPSGVALAKLFERWGIAEEIQGRLVTAPPGVPVAGLVAKGEVALGFQQLSEMQGVPGLHLVGMLPAAIAIDTTFSGAVASTSQQIDASLALLRHLAAPARTATVRAQGMEPAAR
jgi:molybdate transport system substrate-binding protein